MCAVARLVVRVSLPAGQMRDRVTVQRATRTTDALGGTSATWATVASGVTVRLQSLTGPGLPESRQADQMVADLTHLVEAHYTPTLAAVTPKDRLLWGTRVLEIRRVDNVRSQNAVIAWHCAEVQS